MMKKILSALMALTLLFSICSPVFSVTAKDAPAKDLKKIAMHIPANVINHEQKKLADTQTKAQPQSMYITVNGPFESAHPYPANNFDMWKYESTGTDVTYLEVVFDINTKTEKDCDFIYILDADENFVGVYSGSELSGKTIKVLGDSFYLVLAADKYTNDYGFKINAINEKTDITFTGTCGVSLNWSFNIETGVLAITGTGDMDNYDYDFDTYDCNTPWRWFNLSILEVLIGNGVDSIGDFAFSDCYALNSVAFGTGVEAIGDYAFGWCWSLKSITMPASVESIGEYAFAECMEVVTVEIPAGVTVVGEGVFVGCSGLTQITVAAANTHFIALDGVLFSFDQTVLVQYPAGMVGEEIFDEWDYYGGTYEIPEGVLTIAGGAFYGCYSLSNVYIPDSVTTIGDFAFTMCSLNNIDLPRYLTTIGEYAFAGGYLSSVNIGSRVTAIGEGAFIECGLYSANFAGNAPTTVGDFVFDYNSEDFTIYYFAGKTGFDNPWHGYPTESMEPFIRIIDYAEVLDLATVKLEPFGFYRDAYYGFGYETNLDVAGVEWKSDSKKVVVNEYGEISNKGIFARAANITLKVTDGEGNVYSQTIKVVFYKYDWQLNYLTK